LGGRRLQVSGDAVALHLGDRVAVTVEKPGTHVNLVVAAVADVLEYPVVLVQLGVGPVFNYRSRGVD
jgi:hypothetical protein